jgi:hypothetical protein
MKTTTVHVTWVCLGLVAGSLIGAGWLALNMFITAAAVVAEIGSHGTL